MLEPHDRRLLLEALRPPSGYTLDHALGTTFSLDLVALLTAPLAFTLFDWEDQQGRPTDDPLPLLEAIRRYADRISIFCQAGQIAVPGRHRFLFGYLEQSVFEAMAPLPNGTFHPKLWVLRFTAPDEPVLYRVLCLSRNLTFDPSWDTVLALDGILADRKKAYARNHPLGNFVSALPGLAHRVPDHVRAKVEQMQEELRRTDFEIPDPFEEIQFWPLGIDGTHSWPFSDRIDRLLVVSPFLSESFLEQAADGSERNVLVSRVDSLATLDPKCLAHFERVYVLNPASDPEEGQVEAEANGSELPFQGLHAKLFVTESGWDASVWTGSANATHAAFTANVEFLVELIGKKSRIGIDAFLHGGQGQATFADLLQEFKPAAEALALDADQERLERLADEVRRSLAQVRLVAKVTAAEQPDTFRVQLCLPDGQMLHFSEGTAVRCWPINLPEAAAVSLCTGTGVVADFPQLSFEALTSFFAFGLVVTEGEKKATARFVLNLPLEGAPADRRERILRTLLQNRSQVLRFLLLLLAEAGTDGTGILGIPISSQSGDGDHGAGGLGVPLFETMVRTLDRHPEKLEHVARLVDDLRRSPGGEELLPEGFELVWQPIWIAYKRMKP